MYPLETLKTQLLIWLNDLLLRVPIKFHSLFFLLKKLVLVISASEITSVLKINFVFDKK